MKHTRIFPAVCIGMLACAFLSFADVAGDRGRPLLGVHRWDMYSGKGATQKQELGYLPGKQGFLKYPEWHDRAPFFCRRTKDVDGVEHPDDAGPIWFNSPFNQERLQTSMDEEIRFAHKAGIDFFIYHAPARSLVPEAFELKNNLDCHVGSSIPEADKLNFVWSVFKNDGIRYTGSRVVALMDEMIDYIKMPNWQMVMGDRPLIMVLRPSEIKSDLEGSRDAEHMTGKAFVGYIRSRVQSAGLNNPYIVGVAVPARGYELVESLLEDGYDAFSDYAGSYGGQVAKRDQAPSYAEATTSLLKIYETQFLGKGLPFIPPCSSMMYPWPRAREGTEPGNKYGGAPMDKWYHYQWPQPDDLSRRLKAVFDFVAAHPEACEAQVVAMYSWNECSEGGGLIPTMGASLDYQPNTEWLDEAAVALKEWRYSTGR